ncbi:hypothetical protein GS3922_08430 [Geobacillus subterraneus]|jgi:hypothetical protein|uniref:Uncharacterized protein n=2 Tax=Geobacillus TaxID=129337 RepID=A0ABM6ABK5_9BACL|nr:hypothetical protein GS3922_08430 [Geobacillus subterraneus]KZS24592.1 hypothetical protein A5418_11365 [Geobacillus subterraneus]OXB87897.1 hypothetical protein B9L21_08310 [Geobacillus uzenensis]
MAEMPAVNRPRWNGAVTKRCPRWFAAAGGQLLTGSENVGAAKPQAAMIVRSGFFCSHGKRVRKGAIIVKKMFRV